MLTGIGLRNFKAFGDEMQEALLSKITLIYGPNSGGKSSIIQSLMLLKQSLDSPRVGYRRELMVRGDTSRGDVDLGGFPTLIHRHDITQRLDMKVGFDIHPGLSLSALVNLSFVAEDMNEDNSIAAILEKFSHRLFDGDKIIFEADAEYTPQGDNWRSASNSSIVGIDNEANPKDTYFFPLWRTSRSPSPSLMNELRSLIADELNAIRNDLDDFDSTQDIRRRRGRRDLILASIPVGVALQKQLESLGKANDLANQLRENLAGFFDTGLSSDYTHMTRISNNAISVFDSLLYTIEFGLQSEDELNSYKSTSDRRKAINRNEGWIHLREQLLEIEPTIQQIRAQLYRLQEIQETYESRLRSIAHLGPIRDDPQRLYVVLGASRAFSGVRGEFTPNILHRNAKAREKVNLWFDEFDIPYKLEVKSASEVAQTGQNVYIELIDNRTKTPVTIADVGFGISCILPIIVEGVASPEGSIICVEQPELHLHPKLQAHLADLMIETALEDGKQWIVETHSELIQLRLCARVAQKEISPEDVAIVFVEPTNNGSEIIDLGVNSGGELKRDWPPGFFDEETEEIMKILESQQYDD